MATPRTTLQPAALGLFVALVLRAVGPRADAAPLNEPSASLGLDFAYDSNVYNGRGPDLVTRVSPHLSWRLRARTTDLRLAYDLGLWNYAFGKARNSINQRFLFGLDANITRRLAIRLANELTSAQDPGYLVRAGVAAPQTGILDNILEGGLLFHASRRVDLAAAYAYRHTTFHNAQLFVPPLHDGDEQNAEVAVSWRATRRDDFRISHRFQYLLVDGSGFATTHSPGVGWRHQLARALDVRLEAGPLVYQAIDGATRNIPGSPGTGLTWRGVGVLRLVHYPWRAAITAVRDLVSGTGAGTVLWADYATFLLTYHADERLQLHGAVGLFANGPAPLGPRRYDGVTADALVDLGLTRNLRLVFYYSFRWQESHFGDPLPSVTRNVLGVRFLAVIGAEATPPRRPVHP